MGVKDESLVNVYASALLDLAFEKGVHAEVLAELIEIRKIVEAHPRFRDFLLAPSLSPEAKKGLIERVFGGSISDHTLNFFKVIIDRRRQLKLVDIIYAYKDGYHERMNELVVKVTSAVELNDGQRDRVREVLKRRYDKDIILEERVRAQILGGIVLKIQDQLLDGSIRTRLESLGGRLSAARVQDEGLYED